MSLLPARSLDTDSQLIPCSISSHFLRRKFIQTLDTPFPITKSQPNSIVQMPSVFDSLMANQHLAAKVAWRVSFIVPCLCLLFFGAIVLTLSDDTPTGPWSSRPSSSRQAPDSYPSSPFTEKPSRKSSTTSLFTFISSSKSRKASVTDFPSRAPTLVDRPSFRDNLADVLCPQTLLLAGLYFCSFGGGLALSSLLVSWYLEKFGWDQTKAGSWAAM